MQTLHSLKRESPAKINLTLHVRGVRSDGYHELESLVAQVDLCDVVQVTQREDRRFLVECSDVSIPCDHSNLAWKAAHTLAEEVGERRGAGISIQKKIPAGAGLGGGSSNAATTLKLLNALWGLGFSHPELAAIGARLGSDVPLFCHAPLCVMRGRGEQIEELVDTPRLWAALLLPGWHCSTPAVYAAWDARERDPAHPPLDELQVALRGPAAGLMQLLYNDLEEPAFEVLPALRDLADQVTAVTGMGVRMSGSGSTLYRLFDDETSAQGFADAVQAQTGVRTAVAPLRTNDPPASLFTSP